jgi:hypothetical protein
VENSETAVLNPCLLSCPLPARRYDFKQLKAKEGQASKLLFKKRMFRETDETITEPQFVNLSYIQAQHDYLQVRQGAGVWVWVPVAACV